MIIIISFLYISLFYVYVYRQLLCVAAIYYEIKETNLCARLKLVTQTTH